MNLRPSALQRPDSACAAVPAKSMNKRRLLFTEVLLQYLLPRSKWFLEQMIDDPFLGYELRKRRVTKILPTMR